MQPTVVTLVAARNGERYLPATLAALNAQTHRPDLWIGIDASSTDASQKLLLEAGPSRVVSVRAKASFGECVGAALALPEVERTEWVWLLPHDAVPTPDALEQLLATAETSPSVVIVGPKLMRLEERDTFSEFGETLTQFGSSLLLHEGELDQGQHDQRIDALGVASAGILIRRDVFDDLEGFDPALPDIDSGLDLGVRARLAGHRVLLQPKARVSVAGGPELFAARSVSDQRRTVLRRRAQLHRRLTYANPFAAVVHWLSLLPLAIARSIMHLLAKRPGSVASEFLAALGTLISVSAILRARRVLARNKRAPWASLRSLRISRKALRERRLRQPHRDIPVAKLKSDDRIGFIESGALWVVSLALIAGIVLALPHLGAAALTGGGLLPMSESLSSVWANALSTAAGTSGLESAPADPLTIVLAILSSLTFWQPSLALVILFMFAPAFAAVSVWFAVRSLSEARWTPAIAAAVWGFAPTLLQSVWDGRAGSVIAHILLPLLAAAVLRASVSWRAAGGASLLLVGIGAAAPSLLPLLLGAVVVAAALALRRFARVLFVLVPALVVFAPLVFANIERGTYFAFFADPGVPLAHSGSAAAVLFAMPDDRLGHWTSLAEFVGLGIDGAWAILLLLIPLLVLALIAVTLKPRYTLLALAFSAGAFATALLANQIQVTTAFGAPVSLWPGGATSALLLGILLAATIGLDRLAYRGGVLGALSGLSAVALALPMLMLPFLANSSPVQSASNALPAFVTADGLNDPNIGTLVLTPTGENAMRVELERGTGSTLDGVRTFVQTAPELSEAQQELSQVVADLVVGANVDHSELLNQLGVRYIVLAAPEDDGTGLFGRARRSLEANGMLNTVGQTGAGFLWQRDGEVPEVESIDSGAGLVLAAQLGVLVVAALIAMPSLRFSQRVRVRRASQVEESSE
ncbi:glycosyltransferase family 2 protein [Humidisolicoccus flavus]|uniref:glycosyltransferase family 2 protein n=1 Tax=Humidisolicoccus flavus TaxID=3111414 RepID=UPI0032561335